MLLTTTTNKTHADRNAPRIELAIPSTRTKAKAMRTTTKKLSEADAIRKEISALTQTGIGKSIITAIAESGVMSSTTVSRKTGYKAMHFVDGKAGVDMEREISIIILALRDKIYRDLEDPQILKKLKKTVTAEDRQRLVKNHLVYRLGYSEEQVESKMSKTSRTDSEDHQ